MSKRVLLDSPPRKWSRHGFQPILGQHLKNTAACSVRQSECPVPCVVAIVVATKSTFNSIIIIIIIQPLLRVVYDQYLAPFIAVMIHMRLTIFTSLALQGSTLTIIRTVLLSSLAFPCQHLLFISDIIVMRHHQSGRLDCFSR